MESFKTLAKPNHLWASASQLLLNATWNCLRRKPIFLALNLSFLDQPRHLLEVYCQCQCEPKKLSYEFHKGRNSLHQKYWNLQPTWPRPAKDLLLKTPTNGAIWLSWNEQLTNRRFLESGRRFSFLIGKVISPTLQQAPWKHLWALWWWCCFFFKKKLFFIKRRIFFFFSKSPFFSKHVFKTCLFKQPN